MSETVESTGSGAILYDSAILSQVSEALFHPRGWQDARPVKGRLQSGGRGRTLIVSDGDNDYVLRHYLRGGLISRIVRDVYVWAGEEKTRAFIEWRLLYKLVAMGLPVPRPVAACYRRAGTFYSADLLTERVPGIVPLSQRIAAGPCDAGFWMGIGAGLERFHRAGVCHADLNAYNVQIGPGDELWLLDFDRGRLREPGTWQQTNLSRLHRSLRKVRAQDPQAAWTDGDWRNLLDGYFQASRST